MLYLRDLIITRRSKIMNLKELFSELSDKRNKNHQTYSFECLLFMSMCAIMAGEDSFTGISDYVETNKAIFDKYFDLPLFTPTHDTFNRLFDSLDPNEFDKWFVDYTQKQRHQASSDRW